MSEWQPIETAPRDGSEILLWVGRAWNGRLPFVGSYWFGNETKGFWMNEFYNGGQVPNFAPTHWRPLPAPPGDK